MEKLQAALSKARKTRQDSGDLTTRNPITDKAPKRSNDVDECWQALTPIVVAAATLEKRRLVTQVANAKAAPFDILRTKILLQMRQNGWKRLAITSPMPSSGKTTIACNLALSLGRQSDTRSMLFDFDLRDPSVDKFLNVEMENGITDLVSGKVDFADQGVRVGPNVAFSMANKAEKDPAKLLLAEETSKVIDKIELKYKPDMMIFDLPSMLVNDDTRAFLKNVDCALIVVRANKTRYNQFDTCEREIAEQTNVLGVALNAYQQANKAS